MYQARACDVETELTAVEGEGRSVGPHICFGSYVSPVRLGNDHLAWMTPINDYRQQSTE